MAAIMVCKSFEEEESEMREVRTDITIRRVEERGCQNPGRSANDLASPEASEEANPRDERCQRKSLDDRHSSEKRVLSRSPDDFEK
jgi:hypothetical protein